MVVSLFCRISGSLAMTHTSYNNIDSFSKKILSVTSLSICFVSFFWAYARVTKQVTNIVRAVRI